MYKTTLIGLATIVALAGCTGGLNEADEFANAEDEVRNPDNGLLTDAIRGLRGTLLRDHSDELTNKPLDFNEWSNTLKEAFCPSEKWSWTKRWGHTNSDCQSNLAVLEKIARCALNEGQSITVSYEGPVGGTNTRTFSGSIGLASGWATKSCGTDCEEKVSACVIALTNTQVIPAEDAINLTQDVVRVNISGLGNHEPDSAYTLVEGAYWGNIFREAPYINGCYADDSLNYTYLDKDENKRRLLMARTCYAFSDRKCQSQNITDSDGTKRPYFDNLTSDWKVRPCRGMGEGEACATELANGNFTECSKEQTKNVITVRRNPKRDDTQKVSGN